MLGIEEYLEMLYDQTVNQHTGAYNIHWKNQLKARFQERLGEFSISGKLEQKPIFLEKIEKKDYVRYRIEIPSIDSLRIPTYVLIPKGKENSRLPAVLALHGHGYGSRELVGLHPDGTDNDKNPGIHNNLAVQLVQKGMVVVAPEIIGFGERKLSKEDHTDSATSNSCFSIASQLLLMGKTLAGLRVFETQRVLDYVMKLDDVHPEKVGCFGFSGGGLVAAFTSILDDRIRATVISGYTNTFKGSIMDRHHCLDNYIPGILELAEMPELVGSIAPKCLFIEAGINDPLFPLKEVKTAVTSIQKIYADFHSANQFHTHFFEGRHEISGVESFDWLYNTLENMSRGDECDW
ncbi:dienelactone hydrolase family protein [Bacillus sp. MRMR6]|uniref:dienelactone hydrolase family protein n=1 Tax=Bacillus sp. MRMR6 TaxID=1928617 RepID=UPI000ADE8BC0|nr:alpha/beta hydrolase family protein [Bacillus sp. MRMR6]